MSAALSTAAPTTTPGPQDPGTNQRAPLLGLLRKIITYGQSLVAALQRQDTNSPSTMVALDFGTFNLALIIARITRGLALAARLETRLLWTGRLPSPANPPKPRPARLPAPPRPPKPSQAEDDAALLRALPTAKEIAAMVRGRPAGEVIVDICRDLGINASHPLWRDIKDAITFHNGSMARMLEIWMARSAALLASVPETMIANWPLTESQESSLRAWNEMCAASTGPP